MQTGCSTRKHTSAVDHHPRRGSIYIIVVGTSLLVGMLGLSALLQQQVNRRAHQAASDIAQARHNAATALRVGMLLIQNDPDWRYAYPDGVWELDTELAKGTYTLEGTDPSDNDLTDNPTEPVLLTGTGEYGDVVHKTQVTLSLTNRGYTCLQSAVHTNADVILNSGATLNNNQILSANNDVDATAASVNCDVEAVNTISGSTYNGTNTTGVAARTMPDVNQVFAYYLANGTVIDKNSLPLGYPSVLKNAGIEEGTTNWTGFGCSVFRNTTSSKSGTASLQTVGRDNYRDGPAQDVTNIIQNGITYDAEVWVRMLSFFSVSTRISLRIDSSGDGVQWFDSGFTNVSIFSGWTKLTKSLTPTWTGTLNSATFHVGTQDGDLTAEFNIDDAVLKETGNDRTIYNQVISPNSNPFGDTNPLGIYIIDLGTSTLFIKNSRIVGTLVLIEPNASSAIGGGSALNWQPAVSGYPALLVDDGDITISPSSSGLNESASQTNFNPAGTPYLGSFDTDESDTYASEIKGLIYSTKKVLLENQPSLTGAIIAQEDVEVSDTLNLTWNPAYVTNPPPGFQAGDSVRIILDSAARSVE